MSYVPKPVRHESFEYGEIPTYAAYQRGAITVYALRENKRPVGFAPWPKQKKRKKKVDG